MTTSVQALPIVMIKEKLIEELTLCASSTRRITNKDVISCYQNVVCIELRLSINSLPQALKARYDVAVENPDASIVSLDNVITAINRASG